MNRVMSFGKSPVVVDSSSDAESTD